MKETLNHICNHKLPMLFIVQRHLKRLFNPFCADQTGSQRRLITPWQWMLSLSRASWQRKGCLRSAGQKLEATSRRYNSLSARCGTLSTAVTDSTAKRGSFWALDEGRREGGRGVERLSCRIQYSYGTFGMINRPRR